MSVSDADRRHLFERLEAALGESGAAVLMELLPPVGWADVARQSDIAALRGEMAELRGEMAELRAELRGEMAELRAHVDSLVPKLIATNVASMVGVAGLVLAAGAVL